MIPAGKKRHRVKLERFVETESGSGAVVETPQLVATVWAHKVSKEARRLGTEGFDAEQIIAWSPQIWEIDFVQFDGIEDPNVKWQLTEGAKVFEIIDVSEMDFRRGWSLKTRARGEDQK